MRGERSPTAVAYQSYERAGARAAVVEAALAAPEPEGHRWPADVLAAARRAAQAAAPRPETAAAFTALVEEAAAGAAYLNVGQEARETWRARAKRVKRWSFARGIQLLDALLAPRRAA